MSQRDVNQKPFPLWARLLIVVPCLLLIEYGIGSAALYRFRSGDVWYGAGHTFAGIILVWLVVRDLRRQSKNREISIAQGERE